MDLVNFQFGSIGFAAIGRYASKSTVAQIGDIVPKIIKLITAKAMRYLLVTLCNPFK
jgi:hypothetical protein